MSSPHINSLCKVTGSHSNPEQSIWHILWAKLHWDRVFSEYFGFTLLWSFHQCSISILVFHSSQWYYVILATDNRRIIFFNLLTAYISKSVLTPVSTWMEIIFLVIISRYIFKLFLTYMHLLNKTLSLLLVVSYLYIW